MDKAKIQEGVKLILEGIGEDIHREGLVETPDRIARMYEELGCRIYRGCRGTFKETVSCGQ